MSSSSSSKTTTRGPVPFVSVCTPTYNRRAWIPLAIHCYTSQDYPPERMEWVVVDDGEDEVRDLFENVPGVKYIRLAERVPLGRKRNIAHSHCSGEYIVCWDDDDYYFPTRVSHAIQRLQTVRERARRSLAPPVMLAGATEMYSLLVPEMKLVRFGPYGKFHSTAGCLVIHRDFLKTHAYDESATRAEESAFLRGFSEPMVQLDPLSTIVCISHSHNTVDKRTVLSRSSPSFSHSSSIRPSKLLPRRAMDIVRNNAATSHLAPGPAQLHLRTEEAALAERPGLEDL
jgi:glycosyltransferase involved in cell wall biosynthesis